MYSCIKTVPLEHLADFEVELFGIGTDVTTGKEERSELYDKRHACISHLETVCEDEFREEPKVGDTIRNLHTDQVYWRITDALQSVDQHPAELRITYRSVDEGAIVENIARHYLGAISIPHVERQEKYFHFKGGRESLMRVLRGVLDECSGVSVNFMAEHSEDEELREKIIG